MESNGAAASPVDVLSELRERGDRDAVLRLLEDLSREAYDKAKNGRVRNAQNERVRQGWFKTVGYLAGQYRQLVRDEELEEMADQIEQLKARQETAP